MDLTRLSGYIISAPILGMCLVGVVLAIYLGGDRPRVRLLVCASALLLALATMLEPLAIRFASELYATRQERNIEDLTRFAVLARFIFNTQRAAAFGLLLWAVFAERESTSASRMSGLITN